MRSTWQLACGLGIAAILTACGGGSGSKPEPTPKLTSEQIHQYSSHSLFAGLLVQSSAVLMSSLALEYAEYRHSPLGEDEPPRPSVDEIPCDHGGSFQARYTPVDPGNEGIAVGDEVRFAFKQCRQEFEGFGIAIFDDDEEDDIVTINGGVRVVITEFNVPELFGKVASAPAQEGFVMSKALKALKNAEQTVSVGTRVAYSALQIGDGEEVDATDTQFDGVMRARFPTVIPDDEPAIIAKMDGDTETLLVSVATSQEGGESLKVSFEEDGKGYTQTVTEFRGEMDLHCLCSDSGDSIRHTINELAYANTGSDPELGDDFSYTLQLEEPIVINEFEFGVASGEMLTTVHLGDDYAEDVTTKFASSGDDATVDISSTGGAAWSGSFEDYLGFDFD